MGNLSHTVGGDSNLVSFKSAARVPITSLKAHFSPIQEGEGTPSPENVREIRGWQGVEVYQDSEWLPGEYQRIEYLESTGNQYFITNIPIQAPIIFNSTQSFTNSRDQFLVGAGYDLDGNNYRSIGNGTYNNKFEGVFKNWFICGQCLLNVKYNIIMSLTEGLQTIIVDGKQVGTFSYTHANPIDSTKVNYGIFCQNKLGVGAQYYAYVKLYNITISNNISLLGHFIPCRRKSDSKPGMYDTVSGEFFTNQGTGEFICGPDIGETIAVEFPVLGKNKLDMSHLWDSDTRFGKILEDEATVDMWARYKLTIPNGIYTISTNVPNNTDSTIPSVRIGRTKQALEEGKVFINSPATIEVTSEKLYIFIRTSTKQGAQVWDQSSFSPYYIQVEEGSTATTYEPYDPDNTVYGGYVDIVNGEIVQKYNSVDLGSLNCTKDENYEGIFDFIPPVDKPRLCVSIYTSYFSPYNSNLKSTFPDLHICAVGNNKLFIKCLAWKDKTAEEVSTLLNGINLIYRIDTPIYHPLLSLQLQALLNQNCIWTNTNDVTEVSYAVHDSAMIRATKQQMLTFAAKKDTENRIPAIYKKLQYISAEDANPYIETSITYPDELETEIHFYNTKNEAFVFGARNGISNRPYCNLNISADNNMIRFDYSNIKTHVATTSKTGEKIFSFHNRIATMYNVDNDTTETTSFESTAFYSYTTNPILLFAVNTDGSPSLGASTGELRIYSAKFWVGGVLVGNFIPCKRKTDNVVGMYDMVTKQFYTSANSDTFTAGGDA